MRRSSLCLLLPVGVGLSVASPDGGQMLSHLKSWLTKWRGIRRADQIDGQADAGKCTACADLSDESPEQAKPKVDKLAETVRANLM
jgi:hypothetical protein